MPDIMNKRLEILSPAIGNRRDLTVSELADIIKQEAGSNDNALKTFYDKNPVVAEYMTLVEKKKDLSKDEYREKETRFFADHPEYKDAAFRKKMFNEIRAAVPEGEPVSVRGGFCTMVTERRSGRSPNGTFPVMNEVIADVEDFKHTKGSVSEEEFLTQLDLMVEHMSGKPLYETNRYVGQGELAIPVKVITEKPAQAAFTMNMFRPDNDTDQMHEPWVILSSPSFTHEDTDKYPDGVFKFIDYKRRIIIIGGSGYAGEIKKSMFGIANHNYPLAGHLSFHCSSVYDPQTKEVTLVFGLSGTGKSTVGSGIEGGQTLSDDETGVNLKTGKSFNLEYGNYYKTGGLLSEPKVLYALENLADGDLALYENAVVAPNGAVAFAADPTANGRVSIPLTSLQGAITGGMYPMPKRIIILSRDVNAVLDPINILTPEQIVYYLNLGYTSKTPGTEVGVLKPIPTYSKWEGGPFYDLKDEIIMRTLLEFLHEYPVEGVLLNSGEGGGPFGTPENERFSVDVTLELARAFMKGTISEHYEKHPEDFEENRLLGTIRPKQIPGLDENIQKVLSARANWERNGHGGLYDGKAKELFTEFKEHAAESLSHVEQDEEIERILHSGPRV